MKKLLLFLLLLTVGFTFTASAQKSSNGAVKVLKFFPNPAKDFIQFEVTKSFEKGLNLQVYNFLGRKVVDLKNINPKLSINLQDLVRGLYLFQLTDKQGKIIETGRFQIDK
jgi:hypothetical protein